MTDSANGEDRFLSGPEANDVVKSMSEAFAHELGRAIKASEAAERRAETSEVELSRVNAGLRKLEERLRIVEGERDAVVSNLQRVMESEAYRVGRWLVEKPGAPFRSLYHRRRSGGRATQSSASASSSWQFHGIFDPELWSPGAVGSIGFLVSSTNLREGRGDYLVASFMAEAARHRGWTTRIYAAESWHRAASDCDVVVAMVAEPLFGTYPAGQGRKVRDATTIAWVRNNADTWMSSTDMGSFDHVVASSEGIRARLRAGGVPVDDRIVALAAPDHAMGWSGVVYDERRGAVISVNERAGVRPGLQMLRQLDRSPRLSIDVAGTVRQGHDLPHWLHHHGALPVDRLIELMRRSTVVVDDRQPGNRRLGAVNSRVFEAIACGALPITDSSAGLAELGLDSVPVYGSPSELLDLLEFYGAHHEERAFLVKGLRRVVQRRHLYKYRLDELLNIAQFQGRSAMPRRADRPAVWVFPDYRAGNPYLDMAYRELAESSDLRLEFVPLLAALGFPRRARTGDVIHIQWTAPILNPARNIEEARDRRVRVVRELQQAADRGARVVWTVHNRQPHDCGYPDEERKLRQSIAAVASLVHVHCDEHAQEIESTLGVDRARLRVIAHPSYGDYYGEAVELSPARERLGISPDRTVFLAFGQVRGYKRIDRLVEFVDAAEAAGLADPLLAVVGQLGRFDGAEGLADRLLSHPLVDARFESVPDGDVKDWFSSADLVVMANEGAVNSGVVALAATFRRLVVAPESGCIVANGAPGQVHTYDPRAGIDGMVAAAQSALASGSASWDQTFEPRQFATAIAAMIRETAPG
jgi:beta-1,4-mannosyltransferase